MDDEHSSSWQTHSAVVLRPFENYFDVVDSESKAYWLGFILADGCVLWNERTGNYGLQVGLQGGDIDHLIMLERDLGGSRQPEVDPRNGTVKLMWYSKYLARRLKELGILPKKSGIDDLPLPIFPEELARHFWRGYFDGDGSLTSQVIDSNLALNFRVSLAGGRVILDAFQRWAEAEVGIRRQKIVQARNSNGDSRTCVLYLGGNRQVAALTNMLYRDCTRMLKRKYEIHLALLQQNASIRPSYSHTYSPRGMS